MAVLNLYSIALLIALSNHDFTLFFFFFYHGKSYLIFHYLCNRIDLNFILLNLLLDIFLVSCSHLGFQLLYRPWNGFSPYTLANFCMLDLFLTCLAYVASEIDEIFKRIFCIVDIVAVPRSYFFSWNICYSFFDLL